MPVINFNQAMASARQALEDAGYAFYTVSDAKKDNDSWVIKADTLSRKLTILVDARTGEVQRLFESK